MLLLLQGDSSNIWSALCWLLASASCHTSAYLHAAVAWCLPYTVVKEDGCATLIMFRLQGKIKHHWLKPGVLRCRCAQHWLKERRGSRWWYVSGTAVTIRCECSHCATALCNVQRKWPAVYVAKHVLGATFLHLLLLHKASVVLQHSLPLIDPVYKQHTRN